MCAKIIYIGRVDVILSQRILWSLNTNQYIVCQIPVFSRVLFIASCFIDHVDYDGTITDSLTVETGVHQGSILVPLLLIIYMNDILMTSKNFDSIKYADHTNLVRPLCKFTQGHKNSWFCGFDVTKK